MCILAVSSRKEDPFLEMLLSQVAFWAWEMQEIMKSLSTPWSVLAQDILCHQVLQGSTLLVKMLILKEKDGFKTEVLNAVFFCAICIPFCLMIS